jgi:type IX secretion system PorP/SprF family membrane protein
MIEVFSTHKIIKSLLKLTLYSFLLFYIANVRAQQVPHYAQYMYNTQVLNPAFVGLRSDFNATLLSRGQWVNVDGAPQTTTFSVNTRLSSGFGFGAVVISDQIGLLDNTNVNLNASYTIPTSQNGRLALGLKGGLGFYNNDLASGITVDNESYASTTGQFFDMGFGMLYSTNRYYVGLSAMNIFESPMFFVEDNLSTIKGLERANYFLTAGAVFDLSRFGDVKFLPSTMIKYTPTLPLSVDLNANFRFNNIFEVGVSYRHQNSVSAMASVILYNRIRIGYAYESYFTNAVQNLSSHEIILRVDLKLKRKNKWLFLDCCSYK